MILKFKMKQALFLITLFCVTQLKAQNYPMSDPSNTGAWILNEHISDEFNGNNLDKSKWWILGENGDYRSKWKGRAPGQFVPHNVRVENGELILSSKWEPSFVFANEKHDGTFYGGSTIAADKSKPITQACIMSEKYFRYGYMEIRCKGADAPVTSAFWTTGYHSEIDMIENYGKRPIGNPQNKTEDLERRLRTNMINWDPDISTSHQNWKVEDVMSVRLAADYHVFGFEWDKDYIKTYFNGKLVRYATRQELESKDQWRHHHPMEIWIDNEVFSWYGLPSQADLTIPAEFKVDYVRIWQKQLEGPNFNALGFEGPFYFQGRSVQWWAASSTPWRISNEKAASSEFSLRYKQTATMTGNQSIFSPFGSSNLNSGNNELKFKIWIDPNTTISSLDFTLNNPWVKHTFSLTGVEKGKWVEVSKTFSRSAISNTSLTNGDRIQITVNPANITGTNALFYIDDISFGNTTGLVKNKTFEFSVVQNKPAKTIEVQSLENGEINIFNSLGAKVKSQMKHSDKELVYLNNLSSGVYFISLNTKKGNQTQKIVLN